MISTIIIRLSNWSGFVNSQIQVGVKPLEMSCYLSDLIPNTRYTQFFEDKNGLDFEILMFFFLLSPSKTILILVLRMSVFRKNETESFHWGVRENIYHFDVCTT
jgi:hypothetical protein